VTNHKALDLDLALEIAQKVARKAGQLLLEGHRQGFKIKSKGNGFELVTEYDRRSEKLIVEALTKAFPDHAVIGEEGTNIKSADARYVWYVDPLDGTTNYAHRLPWYAVSIGLEEKGQPVLGVIEAPEQGWQLWAIKDRGAFLEIQEQPIQTRGHGGPKRLAVSNTTTLDESLVATGFPYDRRTSPHNNLAQLETIIGRCQGIRRIGVASLDCAMVAWGALDAYWEFKLHPWDICAGALLVQEAGGDVTAPDGSPFVSLRGDILATNGIIHQEMIEALQDAKSPRGDDT
jgi:myo-inositol-1(or 4)-monophosphatase